MIIDKLLNFPLPELLRDWMDDPIYPLWDFTQWTTGVKVFFLGQRLSVLCFEIFTPSLFSLSALWRANFKTKHAGNH